MTDIDLDKLKNTDPFKVPDEYFEQLPQQVMQKIHKQKKQNRRRIWIPSVAASLLVIICSVGIFNLTNSADSVLEARQKLAEERKAEQIQIEEQQLKDQMIRYYSDELAQMEYFYY